MDTVSMYGKFSEASDLDVLFLRLQTIHGYANSRIANSRTGRLAD